MFLDYLWGIETRDTVEEIAGKYEFLDYLWGIETSSFSASSSRARAVFRLPMRNWNFFGYVTIKERSGFLDYLWGIETNPAKLDGPGLQVFRLPMRNWNNLTEEMYEEMYKFLDYLWGIETWEDKKEGRYNQGF